MFSLSPYWRSLGFAKNRQRRDSVQYLIWRCGLVCYRFVYSGMETSGCETSRVQTVRIYGTWKLSPVLILVDGTLIVDGTG